jgi:hypothetical protein
MKKVFGLVAMAVLALSAALPVQADEGVDGAVPQGEIDWDAILAPGSGIVAICHYPGHVSPDPGQIPAHNVDFLIPVRLNGGYCYQHGGTVKVLPVEALAGHIHES